jgi:hypothetical protein
MKFVAEFSTSCGYENRIALSGPVRIRPGSANIGDPNVPQNATATQCAEAFALLRPPGLPARLQLPRSYWQFKDFGTPDDRNGGTLTDLVTYQQTVQIVD